MGIFGGSASGYGDSDQRMADALRSAGSKQEADQIARDNGLRDAGDAADWLEERS